MWAKVFQMIVRASTLVGETELAVCLHTISFGAPARDVWIPKSVILNNRWRERWEEQTTLFDGDARELVVSIRDDFGAMKVKELNANAEWDKA